MAVISYDGGVMKTDFLSIKVVFRYILSAFLDLFFKGLEECLAIYFSLIVLLLREVIFKFFRYKVSSGS